MKTRIIGDADSCYHVMSRIIERRFYLGHTEKDVFKRMLWRVAEFSGMRVITYCVMDNHFHILVQVPERIEIDDQELYHRLQVLYGNSRDTGWNDPLGEFERSKDDPVWRERLRRKYLRRMYDLSEFMRTLKLRYSFWFNRTHNRHGPLWDSRFRSVLVQSPLQYADKGTGMLAVTAVAAYIDLNAVRAGVVENAEDYRWCGYAEARSGNKKVRAGYCFMYGRREEGMPSWENVLQVYRGLICPTGNADSPSDTMAQTLRTHVRYFSRGLILGGKDFVEAVFSANRGFFSAQRKSGARKMRGNWKGLCAARQVG